MARVYRYRRKRARQARLSSSKMARSRMSGLLSLVLFGSLLSIAAAGAVAVLVYRTYAGDLTAPDQAIAASSVGGSVAFDRTGQHKLYTYVDPYGGLRDPKPLTDVSPYLIAATIATEDNSFYSNPGVNFRGLARAAIENLTPFGAGGFLGGSGGSSITQQLVKNVYIQRNSQGLAPRTAQRKIKETVLALEMKRKYGDNQILEWYLNQIYYGNFSYGAEAAAKQFFGKSAKDLTLAQAALLAGLPQAPGDYDPTNPAKQSAAKAREEQVLDLMKKHLYDVNNIKNPADLSKPLFNPPLTPAMLDAAKKEAITYVSTPLEMNAPHFVLYVQDQVQKMCQAGLFQAPGSIPCDKVVTQGGLRITTTLDTGLQDIGQRVVQEQISKYESRYRGHDGSLVSIRPGTGEILAYVGSRDFTRKDISGQVDIASAQKSHGSTMKVFTYLTAFQQGWTPSTYVKDAPLTVPSAGGKKSINNWNFSYMGTITIRKAIAESVNTAAVRTVMDVGIDSMRDTAHRLGITDLRQSDCGPTITLGACEVKQVDMAFAFATIDNNGVMKGRPTSEDLPSGFRELDPVSVLKIQDADGKIIYQYQQPEERQVIDPAYAYMITNVLSKDAISWSRLTIDRPAATKTGTSEDFRDNVVLGYTPDLVAAVWMGNADNTRMANGTFSSAGAGPIWKQFMTEASKYLQLPPRDFTPPSDVVMAGCGGRQEVFKADQAPTKPGACRGPAPKPSPGAPTQPPTPRPPVFPPRFTPSPAASPSPSASPSGAPSRTPFSYTVQPGDTLDSIAAKFAVTVDQLRQVNGLSPGYKVKPGDVLVIPAPG